MVCMAGDEGRLRARHEEVGVMAEPIEAGVRRETLTMREACAILGIHESTGYRLAAAGKFPVRVLDVGWSKKVSRSELERYLNGQEVAS